jgi:DNA-binding winged helix-turn-helix (wHTH) protein
VVVAIERLRRRTGRGPFRNFLPFAALWLSFGYERGHVPAPCAVVIAGVRERPLARILIDALPACGCSARLAERASRRDDVAIVEVHSPDLVTVGPLSLRRWTIDDVAHAIDISRGRARAELAHLTLDDHIAMVGPESHLLVDGRQVSLTSTERRLLRHLLRRPEVVRTRAQLVTYAWPIGFHGRLDIVDTYVGYLRRKLNDELRLTIRSVYGIGYAIYPSAPPLSSQRGAGTRAVRRQAAVESAPSS